MNADKSSVLTETAEWEEDFREITGVPEPIMITLERADAGERLDKILAHHLEQFSRGRLQQWIDEGHVQVDGKPCLNRRHVVLGVEQIEVLPQLSPETQAYHPEAMLLDVVDEDDALIVLNKPSGLVVHPAAGNWSGTLLNGVLYQYPDNASVPRAGIVHRLDRDTSGLMVVARTLESQTNLVRQLQARTVRREYLTLVWGETPEKGTVNAPIGRHATDRTRMAVPEHSQSAKQAVTHFSLEAVGNVKGRPVSLLYCRLETGRTHQIRVHMQYMGHPLVGDPVYGRRQDAAIFPRQALHAFKLGLLHPVSGQYLEWQVAPPEDIRHLLQEAGFEDGFE